eukprot:TRINITY_DN897_c0_g1_i1.p1 TRINITY_DN897_c0_g1~~TRINITY_DN897_c0_g1_i1.p1  ORF type:complete len:220 (-),score=2.97 TRINITY_DN897_c0_g1_i1:58-717(-)
MFEFNLYKSRPEQMQKISAFTNLVAPKILFYSLYQCMQVIWFELQPVQIPQQLPKKKLLPKKNELQFFAISYKLPCDRPNVDTKHKSCKRHLQIPNKTFYHMCGGGTIFQNLPVIGSFVHSSSGIPDFTEFRPKFRKKRKYFRPASVPVPQDWNGSKITLEFREKPEFRLFNGIPVIPHILYIRTMLVQHISYKVISLNYTSNLGNWSLIAIDFQRQFN